MDRDVGARSLTREGIVDYAKDGHVSSVRDPEEGMEFRSQFRLSMQRALWGMITPSLRAIAMGWDDDIGRARFIFDDVPGADEEELVDEVETEVIADFPEDAAFDFTLDCQLTDGLDFKSGERWWAYVRREESA